MSAEERERGTEPAGVAAASDEPTASESPRPARPAERAPADAPDDEPAASGTAARSGEAPPPDAPSEPTAQPGEAPPHAPSDPPATAAAPEATDTTPAEAAGAASETAPAASQPELPAASEATAAASQPGLPAVAGTRDGLDAAALGAVLAAVFPSSTPCRHWCARPDAIGPLAAGLPADLAAWAEGRAWSAGAEVRWQQDGPERYRALYLAEGDTLPEDFAPLDAGLRALPGEAEPGLYLWGRRGDDGRYHATRLPRALDYPAAAGAPEVRLPYRQLVGPDGMVRFLRLTLGEES
jgi:hypothetical protein